jgi:ubiquinone/menaquinone biosynthesis C-methylase UbiE
MLLAHPRFNSLMETKSQKELAFLHDLYVATDWGERFAALVDEHLQLPKEGRMLYVAAGTGGHALALHARGEKLSLLCVDENEECLELARTKAVAVHQEAEFQREDLKALSFKDNEFDLVPGDASFTPPTDLKPMLAEMVRVTRPGGTVAWWLPTASSFGEFFSIYWEALVRAGLENRGSEIERLIADLPTIANVESWVQQAGLESVISTTTVEEFDYDSGEQFLASPLITDFLIPKWLQPLPDSERDRVVSELATIVDEERHEADFTLTLKATLVVGRKCRDE